MRLSFLFAAAVLAAGLLTGTSGTASAQSERSLGISCAVAGHAPRCGGMYNSYRGRHWRHWRRWHRHH